MPTHLTKRLVDSVPAPAKGSKKVYDDQLTGFGLVVYASGRRSFFIEYGPKGHRKRMTLGQYGPLTVEKARELAKVRLSDVVLGDDPLERRQERARVPNFGEWVDEYLEGAKRRKKAPDADVRYLGRAKKLWGSRPLGSITTRDIKKQMLVEAERGNTPATRWRASVRSGLTHARDEGLSAVNPGLGIKQFRENPPRSRVLSAEEYERFHAVVEAYPDIYVRLAFQLMRDLGPRKSEVLRARWVDMDLQQRLWRIPSPKSDRPQVIPLSEATVALLEEVPRLGPWVIPGRDPSKHRVSLKRPWEDIREAAALEGVTIHDVRRTFGLHVSKAAGLHMASKLLRHSDIRVTERVYAPLGIEELRGAVEKTAGVRREGGGEE